jgi:hypothetical protein
MVFVDGVFESRVTNVPHHLARNFSAFSIVMTTEMTQTSFNLDESVKETVLLAEKEVWLWQSTSNS